MYLIVIIVINLSIIIWDGFALLLFFQGNFFDTILLRQIAELYIYIYLPIFDLG